MSTNRSREMSRSEHQAFANALRQALGLEVLYGRSKPVAESLPWWAPFMGDGNRRIAARPTSSFAMSHAPRAGKGRS